MNNDFKDVKKILLIKLRHLGDVLLTVPSFRALREKFPQAHISALVNSETDDALTGNPLIDEVMVFDRAIKKLPFLSMLKAEFHFLKKVREKNFDMVLDMTPSDRGGIISYISKAKYRISFKSRKGLFGRKYLYSHLVKKNNSEHMVLQNLSLLQGIGIDTDNLSIEFYIPDKAKKFVLDLFKKEKIRKGDTIVHVHPLSRWFFKCWKDEYMSETINWLLQQGLKVIVTSGPEKNETEKIEKILSMVNGHVINVCGQTNIKELAAVSKSSHLFLGIDSAPMHIASALKVPVIALFGPTKEHRWGPWKTKSIVLSENLDCKPCRMSECKGTEPRECLEIITPEKVKETMRKMLILELDKSSSGVYNTNDSAVKF